MLLLLLTACDTTASQQTTILVSLVVDGRERTFEYNAPITVGEFLRDADVDLGELDDVNPPAFTQIADGMRVTVVRVREEQECEDIELPYRRQTVPFEGLQPGEERIQQQGQNGVTQVCYRIEIRDGIAGNRQEISRTVVSAPIDEIVAVGPAGALDPVSITGTLAYVNNGNAWVMSGSSTTRRNLTNTGDVDGRVFSLSEDGRRLLFSRAEVSAGAGFSNRLYLYSDINEALDPIPLQPINILYAEWVPGQENTMAYSTAEARSAPPGWQAYNDLWLMRLDPISGEALSVEEVVEANNGGFAGWWGTGFAWSRDGSQLAWARANGIGLVNLNSGEFTPLLSYTPFSTPSSWSWRAHLSWSGDDQLILTTVHGEPIGSEPPESSPAFHVAAVAADGTFSAEIAQNAGIWSNPDYSPALTDETGAVVGGYIAYLRARSINNSISETAEYDLMVADRDGSNARILYPPTPAQPGLTAREFAWSPDARQIAFIYQGSLWIVDVSSGVANQVTLDTGASRPVWMR
ncbi:MAG: G5 domain-containing protein [Chloroflexota bacterium]|nr:G5 domain-containing protein [Chloroflexota bacterium]